MAFGGFNVALFVHCVNSDAGMKHIHPQLHGKAQRVTVIFERVPAVRDAVSVRKACTARQPVIHAQFNRFGGSL
jgi:hypothetical protein